MKKILSTGILLVATALLPDSSYGQAWVSPKGTGSVAITYINNFANKDYFGHGENFIFVPPEVFPPDGFKLEDFGEARMQGMYFDFGYSFTDKLGFTASIPYLASKYEAPSGETSAFFSAHQFEDGSIPLDDGNYHGSFQDFAFRLRYNVATSPFMITPFVEYNQPSHSYLTYSHAIVGRNVRSLAIGTYAGSTLDRWLPNSYFQARYAFAFDEEVLNISRNRHIGDVEFGYFINPSVRAFTILVGQYTVGGLNAPEDLGPPVPQNPLFFEHTRITRDNYLNIGFGGQYSINDSVDFYGLVSHMITARNLHALTYGITFGFSWGFGGGPQRPCHC